MVKIAELTEEVAFTVGLNITVKGSKKMLGPEIDALVMPDKVRVQVTSEDGTQILLNTIASAKSFSTGSVGYGVNMQNLQFRTLK